MPFVDQIKQRSVAAMKEKDDLARDILRLAYGEIQTAEARAARSLSDEEAIAVVRKLVKSNEETLAASAPGERADALRKEIVVLTSLLPATMGIDQIVEALASQRDAIVAAKNDGQATGVAMKHLKSTGGSASGNDVTAAVKKIRGSA